ncbi:2143_t:CDS:10 [Diversispora eburnea]|uniref:2143_t:CDS:1 n=1 Tax=Diversispora eburnea TaxID=1213867 RepID=A0A9N8VKV1_9GLOM|nr:2143_t:CDS:10 [Diversispora eburnea]
MQSKETTCNFTVMPEKQIRTQFSQSQYSRSSLHSRSSLYSQLPQLPTINISKIPFIIGDNNNNNINDYNDYYNDYKDYYDYYKDYKDYNDYNDNNDTNFLDALQPSITSSISKDIPSTNQNDNLTNITEPSNFSNLINLLNFKNLTNQTNLSTTNSRPVTILLEKERKCKTCAYINLPTARECEVCHNILTITARPSSQSNIKGIIRLNMPSKLVQVHENYKMKVAKKLGVSTDNVTHTMFHGTTSSFDCDPERFLMDNNLNFCKKGCGCCGIAKKGNRKNALISNDYTNTNARTQGCYFVQAEYRSLDGTDNNLKNPDTGSINQPLLRTDEPNFYDSSEQTTGQLPMPRCISDRTTGIQMKIDDRFKIDFREKFKSKRNASHMTYLPMNRTWHSYNGPKAKTINEVTSFLDGSSLYGSNSTKLNTELRDPNDMCKMLLDYESEYAEDLEDAKLGYLPKDSNGKYLVGYAPRRGGNIFTNFFQIIFLREHNRRCNDLRSWYGNSWDDEKYFQEARKWVIALLQRTTFMEYLPTILGNPLETYKGYNPDLTPGIQTFFSAATFRQEEVDIFYADSMRSFRPSSTVNDIASIDLFRGRDQGLPKYNQARVNFGFTKANSWSDITNNTEVQERLNATYSNIDQVEVMVGGLAEDHISESNFGPLFLKNMIEQWTLIRDSDRFFYKSSDAGFNDSEILEVDRTSFRDIIVRNSAPSFIIPQNVWIIQPQTTSSNNSNSNDNEKYSNSITCSKDEMYKIKWKIDEPLITFKLTIKTTKAWFGIGFSRGGGMIGADFIIARTSDTNTSSVEIANYRSVGNQIPVLDDVQIVKILSSSVNNGISEVVFTYPLKADNKITINDESITLLCAWKPGTNVLSSHIGNRNKADTNLFDTDYVAQVTSSNNRNVLFVHGIAMIVVWSVIFPASIFVIRYMKHSDKHRSHHKNLQFFGSMVIFTFGAIAIASSDSLTKNLHNLIGAIIYSLVFVQLGLGLLTMWCLASVESVNRGVFIFIKKFHLIFGILLMGLAAFNIYLGIGQYGADPNCFWRYSYLVWLVAEIFYQTNSYKLVSSFDNFGDANQRIRSYIPNDVYDNLPCYSWDEINKRTQSGASLVVAEGLLFDIHKWIKNHPGGVKILQRVIDITNDFYYQEVKDEISIDYDQNKTILETDIISNVSSEETTLTSRHKKGAMNQNRNKSLRFSSIAHKLDKMNAINFKNSRMAIHNHSRFASAKLASMVIGKVISHYDISQNSSKHSSFARDLDSSNDMFKRYILVNTEIVTGEKAERPVKRFTFQQINSNERSPKFLPGEYVELMCHIKGQVVIRPYTPLQGISMKTFSILVKIYENGLMSQHLVRYEIKVRGPLDLGERMNLTPSQYSLPYSPITPSSQFFLNIPPNRILLNPKSIDGCWDVLFMVCGGTDSDYLSRIVLASNGTLTITHVLSKKPENNVTALTGYINQKLLFEWMSKNYTPMPTSASSIKTILKDRRKPSVSSAIKISSPTLIPTTPTTPTFPYNHNSTNDNSDDDKVSNLISTISAATSKLNNQPKNSNNKKKPVVAVDDAVFEIVSNNDTVKYMKDLTEDPRSFKFIVCGPQQMMNSVTECLENLKFPIKDKALFIN